MFEWVPASTHVVSGAGARPFNRGESELNLNTLNAREISRVVIASAIAVTLGVTAPAQTTPGIRTPRRLSNRKIDIRNANIPQLREEFQILTLAQNGFITGLGGAPFGSATFSINCSIVQRLD
jgi:hypothetical protein